MNFRSDPQALAGAKEKTLRVNKRQKHYYDVTDGGSVSSINSFGTNLWRKLRRRLLSPFGADLTGRLDATFRDWMGDVSDKKVLEFGCGSGSDMSAHLAEHSRAYHAIDLSETQISNLKSKIAHLPKAHFHVADFLADAFTESGFDIIYARSVIHHFEDIDVVLDRMDEKLTPGGIVVTFDPLQTWWGARLVRRVFRPFQTDSDWEFPFDDTALRRIEDRYTVKHCIALFRRAKWAIPLVLLAPRWAQRLGRKWLQEDFSRVPDAADKRAALQICYCLVTSKPNGAP